MADEDEGDEVNFRRQGRAPMLIGASLVVVGALAAIVLLRREASVPSANVQPPLPPVSTSVPTQAERRAH